MADERDRHARLAVERLLEREDHEQPRDGLADAVDSALAPGPDLGRDEVDDADAAAVQLAREPQVEVRIVDEDRDLRRVAVDLLEDPPEDAAQVAQVLQHLE